MVAAAEAYLRAERAQAALDVLPYDVELSDLHHHYNEAIRLLNELDDPGLDAGERDDLAFSLDERLGDIRHFKLEAIRILNKALSQVKQLPLP